MNRAEYAALVERRACHDGMCWAEPLIEACDYWKAEAERLRETGDALADAVADIMADDPESVLHTWARRWREARLASDEGEGR